MRISFEEYRHFLHLVSPVSVKEPLVLGHGLQLSGPNNQLSTAVGNHVCDSEFEFWHRPNGICDGKRQDLRVSTTFQIAFQ